MSSSRRLPTQSVSWDSGRPPPLSPKRRKFTDRRRPSSPRCPSPASGPGGSTVLPAAVGRVWTRWTRRVLFPFLSLYLDSFVFRPTSVDESLVPKETQVQFGGQTEREGFPRFPGTDLVLHPDVAEDDGVSR